MVGLPDAPSPLVTVMPVPAVIVLAVDVLELVLAIIPLAAGSLTVPKLVLAVPVLLRSERLFETSNAPDNDA